MTSTYTDGKGLSYCFCWCGRATWEGDRCKWHKGKDKPMNRIQSKSRGHSSWQTGQGGFNSSDKQ